MCVWFSALELVFHNFLKCRLNAFTIIDNIKSKWAEVYPNYEKIKTHIFISGCKYNIKPCVFTLSEAIAFRSD